MSNRKEYLDLREQIYRLVVELAALDSQKLFQENWELIDSACGLISLDGSQAVDLITLRVLDEVQSLLKGEGNELNCAAAMQKAYESVDMFDDVNRHRAKLRHAAWTLAQAFLNQNQGQEILIEAFNQISDDLQYIAAHYANDTLAARIECAREQLRRLENIRLTIASKHNLDVHSLKPRKRLSPLAQAPLNQSIDLD